MRDKNWRVDIVIDEHETRTRATARLHTDRGTGLVGIGTARLNPADANVPEIGDELATARALSDLAHRLLDAAAGDIEEVTHQPAHLRY
ncbi:hypothetical protein GCM10017786_15760 [Amycolatopsis deserti]|uniref:DUF1876 domain-containing protein n=1 Tax=Amycolatopsis deserti TaxID=185696 RepID=A0ABQ3IHK1_9PSEU|nr:DUF1876 domain-containing protein [Amycolatopsis deserti]GHE84789.1 hypothetical protein GCM10017786_15760 [Amycolatopsis deserti]